MNRDLFLVILLLSGCAAADPPPLPPVPEQEVIIPPQKVTPKAATVAVLTPKELLTAAAQAKTDATGYVAWKKSKPENIERLTTLTVNLDNAVKKMEQGHYTPGDVVAARGALKDLQTFLQNKGD